MVEVVFHEVVLGEIRDVCVLHVRDVGGVEEADVHFCDWGRGLATDVCGGGGGLVDWWWDWKQLGGGGRGEVGGG